MFFFLLIALTNSSPWILHFPGTAIEFKRRGSALGLSLFVRPALDTSRRPSTCLSIAHPCSARHRLSPAILASTRRSTPSLPLATPIPSRSSVPFQLMANAHSASSCPVPRRLG